MYSNGQVKDLYFCKMQRFRIDLSYKGTNYFGWQRQPNQISVQEVIENSLSLLNGKKSIQIVGCGRTDTGVHASDYVLHVDLPDTFNIDNLVYKINKILPNDIAVHHFSAVKPDFHARFDAISRTYRYFIHQEKSAFLSDRSLYFPHSLNIDSMNEACELLLGKQDFTSFSKLHTDAKTNICTIYHAQWTQESSGKLCFEIKADRFLRNMVRAIVGTMIEIGQEKIKKADLKEIILKKDRCEAKVSVPPQGLFLWKIEY
jgi:tRNA pseudouridine38-40 synthase